MTTAVSLFSGVGGFDIAMERAGIKVTTTVEIDKNCQTVLKERFPNTQILGDITQVKGSELLNAGFDPRTGIITGGFPCQDLSVAGKRAGLEGKRSGLFWEICRLLRETKAQNIILENVPGLLSSNEGRDMAAVVEALVELGYGIAWRVLDAQYFEVPQRRRRVFIVGCLGDSGRTPAEVLAITESRSRYLAQGGKSRKTTTKDINGVSNTVGSLLARDYKGLDQISVEENKVVVFDPHRSDGVRIQNNTINTLTSMMGTGGNNMPMIAYSMHGGMVGRKETAGPKGAGFFEENEPSYTLTASAQAIHGVVTENHVRRLTPLECERLQGFPDGWTEGQPNGHRYKQMGNAVAVPVVEWVVNRLQAILNSK